MLTPGRCRVQNFGWTKKQSAEVNKPETSSMCIIMVCIISQSPNIRTVTYFCEILIENDIRKWWKTPQKGNIGIGDAFNGEKGLTNSTVNTRDLKNIATLPTFPSSVTKKCVIWQLKGKRKMRCLQIPGEATPVWAIILIIAIIGIIGGFICWYMYKKHTSHHSGHSENHSTSRTQHHDTHVHIATNM